MKKTTLPLIAFFLAISIGNYARLSGNENVRTIQFLSIFTIGAFSSLLIFALVYFIKNRNLKKERIKSREICE